MNHPFKIAMQVIKTLSAFMLLGLFNTTLTAATPDKNGVLHEERSLYTRILVHQKQRPTLSEIHSGSLGQQSELHRS